jgi:DNA polymerase-3 subunit alpha
MHAGGVLIAPGKLTDFCPLYTQAGTDALVSQFDKDDVEAVGLVKFDFLGLTTLTILDWTLRYITRLDPASELRLETLPLDDKATYDVFKAANTAAVFRSNRAACASSKQAPPTLRTSCAGRVVTARPDGAHPDVHGAQDRARALRIPGSRLNRSYLRSTA